MSFVDDAVKQRVNIDLIIIFDLFFFSFPIKTKYICLMDFIVYVFILIYLPKYILHNVNIYDLGNSPVACTTLCRIPIENFICICVFQFNKNI